MHSIIRRSIKAWPDPFVLLVISAHAWAIGEETGSVTTTWGCTAGCSVYTLPSNSIFAPAGLGTGGAAFDNNDVSPGEILMPNNRLIRFLGTGGNANYNYIGMMDANALSFGAIYNGAMYYYFNDTLRWGVIHRGGGAGLWWFGESSQATGDPGADGASIITLDDGAGNTQIQAQFHTGNPVVLASQDGFMHPPSKTFSALGTPSDGVLVYCPDCTISNPCAGSGKGAMAKRLNGVWVCN